MDVRISFDDRIPVLVLSGRFDGFGAECFDRAAEGIDSDAPFWVLDVSDVRYLSSLGIRSLVALEQKLRARDGGLIVSGAAPFVRKVLEMSRLEGWLRLQPGVSDALAMARAKAVLGPPVEQQMSGRLVRIRRLAHSASTVEWWNPAALGVSAGNGLVAASLGDLGFAVGTGGFGENLADARETLGTIVSTPLFAGVLPAESHGVSDFIVGDASDSVPVHVAAALGLHGTPALVAEISGSTPFTLLECIDDFFAVAGSSRESVPEMLGFVAVGQDAAGKSVLLAVGVAFDAQAARATLDRAGLLATWPGRTPLAAGRSIVGAAISLQNRDAVRVDADVLEAIRPLADADALAAIVPMDAGPPLARATVWLFTPTGFRSGAEKLLQVTKDGPGEWRPEWDAIVRRLYSDCRSATLTPLHGGFMSTTFRVVAYDREGRRTLPTVLKIGPTALTAREEQANRDYVARFILNNGTTVLGGAQEGEWAGLRYNFLGVNGPESRLVWLREHYLRRDTPDIMRLFETLLTSVLKPWYAQPKWEQVFLYRDHTPLRLFPHLFDAAERELGISAEAPTFDCPELGLELPNPMHFLKHEYPRRAAQSRLWYTTICHGDLNLQNVLVDERENVYVIDFSETRPRNAVSDFARLEPILKFEMTPLETDDDLRLLLEFEAGLTSVTRLDEPPPFAYRGSDPMVARAHEVIAMLRGAADTVTLFEQDMVPYWLALLEWTYSVICYVQVSPRHKRYALCSAALVCRAIQQTEC